MPERHRSAHHGGERRAADEDHAAEEEEVEAERDQEEGLAEQGQALADEAQAVGGVETALEDGAGLRAAWRSRRQGVRVWHWGEDGRERARGKAASPSLHRAHFASSSASCMLAHSTIRASTRGGNCPARSDTGAMRTFASCAP